MMPFFSTRNGAIIVGETETFLVESRTDPLREMNWKFIRCYKSNE